MSHAWGPDACLPRAPCLSGSREQNCQPAVLPALDSSAPATVVDKGGVLGEAGTPVSCAGRTFYQELSVCAAVCPCGL